VLYFAKLRKRWNRTASGQRSRSGWARLMAHRIPSLSPSRSPTAPYVAARYNALVQRRRNAVRCNAVLGFAIVCHCYYYISYLLSRLDVSVCIGNFFKPVASVNDRFKIPRLYKLFDKYHVHLAHRRDRE